MVIPGFLFKSFRDLNRVPRMREIYVHVIEQSSQTRVHDNYKVPEINFSENMNMNSSQTMKRPTSDRIVAT